MDEDSIPWEIGLRWPSEVLCANADLRNNCCRAKYVVTTFTHRDATEYSAKVNIVIPKGLKEAGKTEKEMPGKGSHQVGFGYANSLKLRFPFSLSFDPCTYQSKYSISYMTWSYF